MIKARRILISALLSGMVLTLCPMSSITAADAAENVAKAEWAIHPQFSAIPDFSEGMANSRIFSQIINRKGEVLYDYGNGSAPRFSWPYSEGISIGTNSPTGNAPYTAMDRDGAVTEIREEYKVISSFSCGMVKVSNVDPKYVPPAYSSDPNTRYGYLNKNYELVIPVMYLEGYDFSEGYAAVQREDGRWIYIDRKNHQAFEGDYQKAESFSEGLAAVMNEEGLWGYIDYNGKEVIPPLYKFADSFSDGVAIVSDGTRQGILDPYGNVVWMKKNWTDSYWMQGKFHSGVCVLRDGDQYGLIDKEGQIVIDCGVWDFISECREGIIVAGKYSGEKYLLNPEGKIIAQADVSDYRESSENLIPAAVPADPSSEEDSGLWGCLRNPEAIPSDWSEEIINTMFDRGYMTDAVSFHYQEEITRQDFCDALVRMLERKTGETLSVSRFSVFGDTRDVSVAKLFTAGIINGISDTEFAPDDELTREQAAKIFFFAGQCFGNLNEQTSAFQFTDDAEISDWAYEAVYRMQANGIIQGYEDQSFRPSVHLTKEQALAMICRLEKMIG